MAAHKDLTGADLHEPKGIDVAAQNTVYVKTSSGSGTWKKIGIDQIDTISIPSVNRDVFLYTFTGINTAKTVYVPCPFAGKLAKVFASINGVPAADITLSISNGPLNMGSVVLLSGAAAGTGVSATLSQNNTIPEGGTIVLSSSGGGATAVDLTICFVFNF